MWGETSLHNRYTFVDRHKDEKTDVLHLGLDVIPTFIAQLQSSGPEELGSLISISGAY
jgi:hypothetical protein